MSRTIQYRCDNCRRLLFKHDTAKDTCEYQDPDILISNGEDGKTKFVKCSKCTTINKIAIGGLVAV